VKAANPVAGFPAAGEPGAAKSVVTSFIKGEWSLHFV
jgi:hypothetical protein